MFCISTAAKQRNSNWYKEYVSGKNNTEKIIDAIEDSATLNDAVISLKSAQIEEAIRTSSKLSSQVIHTAINRSTEALCTTMKYVYSELDYDLNNLNHSIENIAGIIKGAFQDFKHQQKITNQYLGKITELVKIPDKQKDRIYYIEEGLKFFSKAIVKKKDSRLYKLAYEQFLKSVEIEPNDYFSLYYLGCIYLESDDMCDVGAAEKAFRDSAYFYQLETEDGGTNFSRHISTTKINYKLNTTQSYLKAAYACYIQSNFTDAVSLAKEALKISPDFTSGRFELANYLFCDNQILEAKEELRISIQQNRLIFYETYLAIDLRSNAEIQLLLTSLEQEIINSVVKQYNQCLDYAIKNSVAIDYLLEIQKLIAAKEFLQAKKAEDLLLAKKAWEIIDGAVVIDGKVDGSIRNITYKGKVVDFLKVEKKSIEYRPIAETLSEIVVAGKDVDLTKSEFKAAKKSMVSAVLSMLPLLIVAILWKQQGDGFFGNLAKIASGFLYLILAIVSAFQIYTLARAYLDHLNRKKCLNNLMIKLHRLEEHISLP